MAKQRIDAIIIQKIATLAEWNNIGRVPEKGEFMLIQNTSSQPVNLKIGDGNRAFSALPDFIQYDQAAYVAPNGNTLPAPQNGVGYSLLTEGSYNNGALVVPAGNLGIADYVGDAWVVRNMGLPTADVSNKLDRGGYQGTAQDIENDLFVSGDETFTGVNTPSNGLANVSDQTCIHGIPVEESGNITQFEVYCTQAGNIKIKTHRRVSNSSPWIFNFVWESSFLNCSVGLNTFNLAQLGTLSVEQGDYIGVYTDATARLSYIAVTSPAFPYQYRSAGDVTTNGVTFTAVSTAQLQFKATVVQKTKIADKIVDIESSLNSLSQGQQSVSTGLSELADKQQYDIDAIYGLDNGTSYAPVQSLASMTLSGGGNNQANFNRFPLDVSKTYISCQIRSVGNQTVTILKLSSDGTTVAELESFPVTSGVVSRTFSTPITIAAGERIGFKGSGGVSFFYSSTSDVGSRNKNQAGTWADSSGITWAFSLVTEGVMPEYDDFTIVTNKIKSVEGNVKASRPSTGIERFNIPVNVAYPNYSNTTVTVSDSVNDMTDMSAVWIPTSYTPTGKPTRLIVYCHGAGSAVNASRTNIEQHPLLQYLRQKGYAILDTNGYPADFWETGEQEAKAASMGGQIAIQATQKAYKYVLDKYNLCNDGVVLVGTSMGGLTSTNVMNNCNIPVLTHVLEAPITDMYNQPWIKPWFGGAKGTRFQLAKFYNFSDYQTFDFMAATPAQRETYWQENKAKVFGFDPVNWQAVIINSVKQKLHKSPLLIFHSVFDTTSEIQWSQNMVNAIKEAGGKAELRTINDGNVYSNQHAPFSFTDNVTDAEGLTTKATCYEAFLWISRYS